jgi:hypothetical protein
MRSVGEARHVAVEAEIRGEKAAALGDAAKRVEAALASLQAIGPDERERLLDEAAEAVWGFLIQRELMGLRDREAIVAYYDVPHEVLNRTGIIRKNEGGA